MRQVFTSARVENVEAVADLLREAGIEVRITDGRSYRGKRRLALSYGDSKSTKPALWVVRASDYSKARELLRDSGLLDSAREGKPSFRSRFDEAPERSPAQQRMHRIRLGLFALVVILAGLAMYRAATPPQIATLAAGPFDGRREATLIPIAQAVLARELDAVATPIACLAVDGVDAPPAVRDALRPREDLTVLPASHCQRVADEEVGSLHPATGAPATIVEVGSFRPTAPDAGTVEYSAYHHRMLNRYKTLEVRRVDGRWQVTRTLRHVAS